MGLLGQNRLSLAIDAVVMKIIIRTSLIMVRSWDWIATKYMKLGTHSGYSPLMVISALVSCCSP
ncbi:hypothetical protein DPMN_175331 [Dreissena polymorpha]|uniref:Uncharacterized protein n=1 Tax=Dreissena polymorpha TaxID=45954 RepID=A0A9D4IH59_DREPO|nr:hypothetical protein DPMN_175331 [Dreissena polymorpha]